MKSNRLGIFRREGAADMGIKTSSDPCLMRLRDGFRVDEECERTIGDGVTFQECGQQMR